MRTSRRARGQAMVEFALVIPLLMLVLMGIFDLGRGVYAYNVVASAAREGARFGSLDPSNTSGIIAQATSTAVLQPINVQVDWSDNGTTFLTTYTTSRKFVRVTVTHTFQPITFLVPSVTLTGRSMMAIEE